MILPGKIIVINGMASTKCWNSCHPDDRTPGVKPCSKHELNLQMNRRKKKVVRKIEKRVRKKMLTMIVASVVIVW